MPIINKEDVLIKICTHAKSYKEIFAGYTFSLIYEKNGTRTLSVLEVSFKAENFKHLTGVTANMKAEDFFNKAVGDSLKESDFEIEKDKIVRLKLSALDDLMNDPFHSLSMTGKYNELRKYLQTKHLVGGEKFCIGFTMNDNGILVPNTILNDDIRKNVKTKKPVLALWRKEHSEDSYSEELTASQAVLEDKTLTKQYNALKSHKFYEH